MKISRYELNQLANALYERLAELDEVADPRLEVAIQNAVNALNELCFITHEDPAVGNLADSTLPSVSD